MLKKISRVLALVLVCLMLVSCEDSGSGASTPVEPEPQEKQLVLKDKSEIQNIVSSEFYQKYDEVDDEYFCYPAKLQMKCKSHILPFINIGEESQSTLVFFNYEGKDWVFMNKAIVKTDNNRYELDFAGTEVKRDVKDFPRVHVEETAFIEMNKENYDMIEDMANSEKTIVRFSGEKSSDLELTDENKEFIRVYLSCFEEK